MKSHHLTFFLNIFILSLISASPVQAQGFTITETLRDSKAAGFTFGGSKDNPNIKAYLTAGVQGGDPEGDGWLRLTNDEEFQSGSAVVNKAFPSKLGVLVDLEYKTWRNKSNASYRGADGFSIFLFDASVRDFSIGGFGGSLGYARHVDYDSIGLSGGFVGIGVDEFGNYSNPTEGRNDGPGFLPNSIGLRGPSPDYKWLGGNIAMTDFTIQYNKGISKTRPTDADYFRRIQIEITPLISKKYSILVRVKDALNGKFKRILGPIVLDILPPDSLQLGFAASTGADLNFHEVRNLLITTPGGVRLTKKVDKLVASVGDSLTYTIDLYNQTEAVLTGLEFNDPYEQFPPEFQVDTARVSFNNDGDSLNIVTGDYKKNLSNISVSLNAFSHASFTVKGIINGIPEGYEIKNSAGIGVGTSNISDPDASNDTASVVTLINPPDFFIPNVFTPNDDGANDAFKIRGLNAYDHAKLKITNRWGDEVYYNPNYDNEWKGDGLNGGTYFYHLVLEVKGRSFTKKGWVLIKK